MQVPKLKQTDAQDYSIQMPDNQSTFSFDDLKISVK
jgi:hypothetical protein